MRRALLDLSTACLFGALLSGTAMPQGLELKPRVRAMGGFAEDTPQETVPPPDDLAEPPTDATHHSSGLISRLLYRGTGDAPVGLNDLVALHYVGWTDDGTVLASTSAHERPRWVRVNQFIDGFSEGLQLMIAGEKRRLWIPEALAYAGAEGKPKGILVFDVEVVEVRRAPPTPPDLDAAPDDAVVTESGLAYKILVPGVGEEYPQSTSMVLVDYTSWRTDGRLYDSSVLTGEPVNFNVDLTVPAFSEVLPSMTMGAKWRLWVPPELANLPDQEKITWPLVFDLELLRFFNEPATPQSVAAIPPDAERTELGVAYRVLRPGRGTRRPALGETVEVIYAGWTRDGKIFDSSYAHGRPGVFELDEKMPIGWNDALKQMVEGEKRLIWIPEELAYGDRKNRPAGMLVFEVELLTVLDEPPPR